MQSLSPKKYIETKARSLPVYRCLVNKDWAESRFADVVVMRRHTNGHITAAIFQVDLLCLGVKETAYIFNEEEEEVYNRIPVLKGEAFVEIEYNLAHNIVFAGHDFALDFDIHPQKDFALTRFILEEDTDEIPLIEIPVGDEEGKPVLIASAEHHHADALAKLKKYAGEGNYSYITEEELEEEEDEEELALDDLELGEVNLGTVQKLRLADMQDDVKVAGRTLEEQILIETELLYTELPPELSDFEVEEESRLNHTWEVLINSTEQHNGVSSEQLAEYSAVLEQIISFSSKEKDEGFKERYDEMMEQLLEAHGTNPVVVSAIYETSIALNKEKTAAKAMEKALASYTEYPLLQLSLALGGLVDKKQDSRFSSVYGAGSLEEAFPGVTEFSATEVIEFWLIKLLVALEKNEIKEALLYFVLLRSAEADTWLLVPALAELNVKLIDYLQEEVPENGQDTAEEGPKEQ
jgi:hypothetical protein